MIIQYTGQMHQVIKSWPGSLTGETKMQTADGTIWTTVDYLREIGTGDRQGVLILDKVFEK